MIKVEWKIKSKSRKGDWINFKLVPTEKRATTAKVFGRARKTRNQITPSWNVRERRFAGGTELVALKRRPQAYALVKAACHV